MQTIQFLIRGRVQGVGFRYFVQSHARKIGIRGYVRNLEDGSVECVGRGSEEQLKALEGILQKGPPVSRVDAIRTREIETTLPKDFEIRS